MIVCNHLSQFPSVDSLPFDSVLEVISQPAFISRCVTGTYVSFHGLVLDIAMNYGILLYRSLNQREFTYMKGYLIILITGINVAFLLTVSPIFKQS